MQAQVQRISPPSKNESNGANDQHVQDGKENPRLKVA